MSKIKICLDDPETRAVWNTVLEARREVASWPAWKRGEDTNMSNTVVCQNCGVSFKYPDLYEEHLLADKSCPVQIELHYLNLITPSYEGQKRIMQLNTVIPIRVQLVAVARDGALRWSTVSIISDASFSV